MKIKSPKAKPTQVQVLKKRPASDTGKKNPIAIPAVEASNKYKKLVIRELIQTGKVQIVKGKGKVKQHEQRFLILLCFLLIVDHTPLIESEE